MPRTNVMHAIAANPGDCFSVRAAYAASCRNCSNAAMADTFDNCDDLASLTVEHVVDYIAG
jgi:hypothetical protein